ncbi:hypothetical protein GA0061078_0582 [Bifidobacterium bohemicum]|uniref:Uncharacterized protein n=1 Tax=Bifidobacterium bohemicum DSM 22767 TaxID=1437606 RepID=A0A086ZJX8_9BIFI|nr:hypothetical protein [Bifidobacterium bohemicum]KFI46828.1 hypothetical protein BBOH_0302 [Bifidobacterium bohemicum DSM 22767]SCB82441.1 hypothetical protein GA0061078_0582 [Bifidobacterium bohemicum]
MGLHQRTETAGILSFLVCAAAGAGAMSLAGTLLSAAWKISLRRLLVASVIIAACGTISFILGYAHPSQNPQNTRLRWLSRIRRLAETLALATVYASTIFLTSYAALYIVNAVMGPLFLDYLTAICAGLSGIAGYVTLVQAEMMDAKTLASLLPVFVIAGVSVAGLTTDDQNWYTNNFSQLGDRTTFAAKMFNSTAILTGICIIIISYFCVSELITTYRQRVEWRQNQGPLQGGHTIKHYKLRLTVLSLLLTLAGMGFMGVGTFHYTPHPMLHNGSAQGLTAAAAILLIALPWIAPQLSISIYAAGYLAVAVCSVEMRQWLTGHSTMTNAEALAAMCFLGWFIMFSRQIASIESDRIAEQIVRTANEEAGLAAATSLASGGSMNTADAVSAAGAVTDLAGMTTVNIPAHTVDAVKPTRGRRIHSRITPSA